MGFNLKGKAWKFGNDVSTDLIAPGRLFHLRTKLAELAKHVLEDANPEFASKVKKGDFIVGGFNFGIGSSREHAPTIIKLAGVEAILAKSFATIFYRNSINLGLPALICNTDLIDEGDELEINLASGIIKDITKGIEIKFSPLSPEMLRILEDGGLLEHIKKHGDFKLD